MTSSTPQHIISAACEEDLIKYGDSFRGVGYTKSPQEAAERYALMLGLIREHDKPVSILDLGCGLGHLLDFIESHADEALPVFDYVVLNGVFNYRGPIERSEMMRYWERLTMTAYRHCRCGMAFNVMSTLVDWERDDLFHLPFAAMTTFVAKHLSRHFVIRHDYQAYEYTTYVYRQPFAYDRR
jgi:hypothetical protein